MTSDQPPVEGGFVRVPQTWIALPITPQAKALLFAFCSFADEKGQSWCSYQQLGEIVQRSKASVCAYVRELQEAGLIKCRKQTYANGYNYRLLITLSNWTDILDRWKSLGRSNAARSQVKGAMTEDENRDRDASEARPASSLSAREPERGDQPAERMDPTGPKTQIYQTKTQGPSWTNEDERAWRQFRPNDADPIGSCYGTPPASLLEKVVAVAAAKRTDIQLLEPDKARELARAEIGMFVRHRHLKASQAEIDAAVSTLASIAPTVEALRSGMAALGSCWKPHWKRLSSPAQLRITCGPDCEKALPDILLRRLVGQFEHRAWFARRHLDALRRPPPDDTEAFGCCLMATPTRTGA